MELAPAFHDIYRDRHPFMVVQKPAQVGGTELTVNLSLFAAASHLGDRGHVLYLLPNQEMADRLSQGRMAQAIASSPPLRRLAGSQKDGVRLAQRMQFRSIGSGSIILSGSDSVAQYTGVDADLVILDEYDQMKDDVLSNAIARLRSSKAGRLVAISTPTIPEFGIHGLLMNSDERHYQLHCNACGTWLEPQFPQNVDFEHDLVVCDCREPLNVWGEGRWIATRPDLTDVRGYQLNRLVLPNPPLRQMRMAANGTIGMKVEEFYRQDLGAPFIASDARLSAAALDACRSDPPFKRPSEWPPARQWVVMGVDVGQDHFWVVIREFVDKRSYPLYIEKVYGDWDVLEELATRFKVRFAVVDAQPDTRGAKRFISRLWSMNILSWRCYYKQAGTEHEWDDADARVTAVRTLALDEMFDAFRRRQSLLPMNGRELAGGAYYEHLQALVRTTEPDTFGQPIPAYRHTRPDDFAHAENYVTLVAVKYGVWNGFWE